jgi:hypothetical protein
MSDIVLPEKKVAATSVSPENLIIFSKPKTGKTELVAQLDNCFLLDLEKGSKYVEALKMEANSIDDIKKIGEAIKAKENPYDYVAVDTITKLEELCIPYAEHLYSKSPMGKNWYEKGKPKYGNILGMPEGAGYYWLRLAFTRVTDYISTWAPRTIFLGHVKDTMIDKEGAQFSAMDLDLTGKLKRMTAANADAIGYLYRKSKGKNVLSFKTTGDVTCGARPQHLKNEEIVISELDESGNLITHWDQIFID